MTVWIGAMMVGSIGTSVEEGQEVKRGDELGWFAFGGSTIVCVFEKNALVWDEDLIQNASQSIETLVRMGTRLGRSTKSITPPGGENGDGSRQNGSQSRTKSSILNSIGSPPTKPDLTLTLAE